VGPRGSAWVRVGPRGSAWVRVSVRVSAGFGSGSPAVARSASIRMGRSAGACVGPRLGPHGSA
jgi:hypothetical protein